MRSSNLSLPHVARTAGEQATVGGHQCIHARMGGGKKEKKDLDRNGPQIRTIDKSREGAYPLIGLYPGDVAIAGGERGRGATALSSCAGRKSSQKKRLWLNYRRGGGGEKGPGASSHFKKTLMKKEGSTQPP